jgi:tagatose 6-phosphate kinase
VVFFFSEQAMERPLILAAGLTPAWQYVLKFDHLNVGEVNRARHSQWFASGKAVNVGLALHHLGASATTLSYSGGATGELLEAEFASTKAQARWVKSATPTRVCTTLIDRASGHTTELVENSAPVSAAELQAFDEAFAAEAASAGVIVFSGSLPNGTPKDFYRRLLDRAASNCPALKTDGSTKLVLDIRGPELLECLSRRPLLVKPNREELGATVGRRLGTDADLLAAMREINSAGAEWVLVTSGPDAAWLTSASETWRVTPPQGIANVNPIGCGDCVAAGIAFGLSQGMPVTECVRLGQATAAANLEQMTSARFAANRVRELLTATNCERV